MALAVAMVGSPVKRPDASPARRALWAASSAALGLAAARHVLRGSRAPAPSAGAAPAPPVAGGGARGPARDAATGRGSRPWRRARRAAPRHRPGPYPPWPSPWPNRRACRLPRVRRGTSVRWTPPSRPARRARRPATTVDARSPRPTRRPLRAAATRGRIPSTLRAGRGGPPHGQRRVVLRAVPRRTPGAPTAVGLRARHGGRRRPAQGGRGRRGLRCRRSGRWGGAGIARRGAPARYVCTPARWWACPMRASLRRGRGRGRSTGRGATVCRDRGWRRRRRGARRSAPRAGARVPWPARRAPCPHRAWRRPRRPRPGNGRAWGAVRGRCLGPVAQSAIFPSTETESPLPNPACPLRLVE